jgi:hypothetical protein
MKDKVAELTKDCKTEYEKIQAIYNFVVTEISYKAWTFGVHGYKPYKAPTIFKRKFGDCKDKAILINTMLREVGITSYPVLINGQMQRSKEDFSLPMFRHFNHAISCVVFDGGKKKMFLDGTTTYNAVNEVPYGDQGALVLVVTPECGRVERVPVLGVDAHYGKIEYTADVSPDGTAEMKGKFKASGDMYYGWDLRISAPATRVIFHVEGKRKDNIERLYGQKMAGAKVVEGSIKFSDLKNLSEPVEYSYTLSVPNLMKKTPRGWTLPVTFFPIELSEETSKAERDFDMLLFVPCAKDVTIRYNLPEKLVVKEKPVPVDLKTKFGSLKIEYKERPGCIVVEKRLEITATRVSREDYPAFRKFVNSIDEEEKKKIILDEKKGGE